MQGHTVTSGILFDEGTYTIKRTALNRYLAININKQETIEFRIFASPKNKFELDYRLEFVKAMCRYTEPCAVAVKSLKELFDKDTFIAFVAKNKKDYPNLHKFIGD